MPTSPKRDAGKAASSMSSPPRSSSASTAASAASTAADAHTSELLHTVASEVGSLVQGELASARREITEKVLAARPAVAKLGAAGVLGAMAAGTSAATLVRALDRVLPRTASALAATALLGGAAAALAAGAREELRRIGSLMPEQTLQNVKADVAAVAEAASTS
jgi:Putative Actinobacterial Holin-X, holin superfamily III